MMTELNHSSHDVHRAHIDHELSVAITAELQGAPQAELRRAVSSFVADAKRTMAPPQDVIASLKTHMQRDAQPHMRADEYPRLVAQVVAWGIEDYYR
ncbi:MAG: hypothetical protein ACT4PJ_09025 [Gemmatimonadaceae bacterium]